MKKVSLLAAAAALLAAPAFAEDFVLKAPNQGMSLHEGPVDMTAYYEPAEGAEAGLVKVTATYATRDAARETGRLVMVMRDGDGVSFELPGLPGATYSFARAGDVVTVRSVAELRTASVE
ncbi:hypothetical protein [Amaricoccus sp. W119]|uniref:hypothetical protein n=1 Tax=Amaricoccus sp. W119 TaxID=3391833 RepID=UPI0039A5F75F